ncbi:hypothetical protein APHAL10511_000244 [Amanita phalloides]|nr:hypothetical protein APHAL10511_000244 [Amanita phalloides]
MFIRFQGGGVGHKSTCKETDQFLSDHHVLDLAEETSCEGEVGEDAEKCFEDTEEESEEDDNDNNDDDDGDDDNSNDDSDDDSSDNDGDDDNDNEGETEMLNLIKMQAIDVYTSLYLMKFLSWSFNCPNTSLQSIPEMAVAITRIAAALQG